MCLHNVKSAATMRLGFVFLILGSIANMASRRMSTDIDWLLGLFYGLAIGLLLLGVRRGRQGGSTTTC